jgi:DNA-binding MarR family transcriptional regulator
MTVGPKGEEQPLLPASLSRRLGFVLVRASAGMTRLGAETLAPLGIDGRHYGVLAVLAELGPVSQQTLADILAVDRSTMVGFVDELEEKGHVRRARNPRDRRAYAIELTESGANAQRDAAELLEACEQHYLEPLTVAERRALLGLLERLVARDLRNVPR